MKVIRWAVGIMIATAVSTVGFMTPADALSPSTVGIDVHAEGYTPGSHVQVTGAGFASHHNVDFYFDNKLLGHSFSGDDTFVGFSFDIPSGTAPGTYVVEAKDSFGHDAKYWLSVQGFHPWASTNTYYVTNPNAPLHVSAHGFQPGEHVQISFVYDIGTAAIADSHGDIADASFVPGTRYTAGRTLEVRFYGATSHATASLWITIAG